eukprot:UN07976
MNNLKLKHKLKIIYYYYNMIIFMVLIIQRLLNIEQIVYIYISTICILYR